MDIVEDREEKIRRKEEIIWNYRALCINTGVGQSQPLKETLLKNGIASKLHEFGHRKVRRLTQI